MTNRKPGLSDPKVAGAAWTRYRRLMAWMAVAAAIAVIATLAYLRLKGGPLPIHMLVATIAGVGFTVLLAAALMGLVFLSSGTGHDEDASDGGQD